MSAPTNDELPDIDGTEDPWSTPELLPARVEYVYDQADVPVAVDIIDKATTDLSSAIHSIPTRIHVDNTVGPSANTTPLVRELASIFIYRLRIDRSPSPTPGVDLEPIKSSGAALTFVRPVEDVPDDVAHLWDDMAPLVRDHLARAYLRDLLFSRRYGNVGDQGASAIRNYLAAALERPHSGNRIECALRAWTLSRRMRRPTDEASARTTMWDLLHDYLRLPPHPPGATFPLITALASLPQGTVGADVPGEPSIDAALEQLAGMYTDEHLVDRISSMQARRAGGDPAIVGQLNRRRVQNRLDQAEAATVAQHRVILLEQAAALGRDLGVTDLADKAVRALQKVDPDSLEWVRHRQHITTPAYVHESYLRTFDVDGDWRAGLATWFATDAPSGHYRDNLAEAKRSVAATPLTAMFGAKRFGAHGLPQSSTTSAQALDQRVRRTEQERSAHDSFWLADALDRIRMLAPTVGAAELEDWLLKTYKSDAALTARLARALAAYWEGRFDEAAHIVVSTVEAAARSLLRELDEPVYRVESGRTIGGFAGLGALLEPLETAGLDEDWKRFLQTVLLPEGANLRNLIAHGLIPTASRPQAAILLRASAALVLVTSSDSAARDATEVRAQLKSIGTPPPRGPLTRARHAWRAAVREFRRGG